MIIILILKEYNSMKKISKKIKRISALLLALLLVITSLNINVRSVRAAEEDPYKEERALYKLIGIDLEYEENVSLDEQLDAFLGDARKMEELVSTFSLYTKGNTRLEGSQVNGRTFIGGNLVPRDNNDGTQNYAVTGGVYNPKGYATAILVGTIDSSDAGFQGGAGRRFLLNKDLLTENTEYKYLNNSHWDQHIDDYSLSTDDITKIIAAMNEAVDEASENLMNRATNATFAGKHGGAYIDTQVSFDAEEPPILIFNMTIDELLDFSTKYTYVNLANSEGKTVPGGTKFIFNITGDKQNFELDLDKCVNSFGLSSGKTLRANTMFHFPEVEEMTVSNAIYGHLFAPKAIVTRGTGGADVESMVVKSMLGSFTIDNKAAVAGAGSGTGNGIDFNNFKEPVEVTGKATIENNSGSIAITVTGKDGGIPTGDVTVTYTDSDGTDKTLTGTLKDDGTTTITLIPEEVALLPEEPVFTITYPGDDKYKDGSGTAEVDDKRTPELIKTVITVDVEENADGTIVIKGQLTEEDGTPIVGADVTVTYTGTDGTKKTVPATTDADGNYTVPADDFKRGVENEVTAEFDATECYNGSVATTKKKTAKMPSEIKGIGQQDENDISVIFTVTVSDDDKEPIYPGTIEVTFTKNGEEVKETLTLDKDGKAKIEGLKASDFKIGEELTFYAHFAGNESYYESDGSAFVVVVDHIAISEPGKDDVEIIVDTTKDGDKVIVEIEVKGEDGKDTPTGSVDVTYTDKDGEEITETVDLDENGKGTLEVDIDKLPEGEVEFEVTYPGDENYNDGEGKADDSNKKRDVEIITTITDKEDSTIIDILVKDPDGKGIPSGTVTVTFDDKAYDIVIDEEGKGQVIIPKKDLSETDKTDITVSYGGDDAYNKGSKELELAVAPPAGAIQLVIFGGCIMVALFVAMYTMKRREEDEE